MTTNIISNLGENIWYFENTWHFDKSPDQLTLMELRNLIDKADNQYYRHGVASFITDATYDILKSLLKQHAPDDERLSRVGPQFNADELRTKIKHPIPMGSLDNIDGGIDGYNEWHSSMLKKLNRETLSVMASMKIDGSSVRASYKDGVLVCVASRGNGTVGDDITANGANFIGLPTYIPNKLTIDVRGEAILYKSIFDYINNRDGISDSDRSNPRNVGNGIIARDDGKDSELINFLAFNVEGLDFATETEKFECLTELGFDVVPHRLINNHDELFNYYTEVLSTRSDLAYEIDGLVVCLNNLSDQKSFVTSDPKSRLRPKYARAIKPPLKSNVTTIVDVLLTVGHSGAIIPTAVLKEVRVGGVNVTHALLNNWDEIERLDIAIGDTVEVALSGDIIPKIISKVKDGEDIFTCPHCGFEGTFEEQERHHL